MTVIVDVGTAKTAARALRRDLSARGVDLTHSAALELVAHQLGHRDWNTAAALLSRAVGERPQLGAPVPVLRVLDGEVGREFYSQLGFELLWEHRFEPDLPLYQRLRRDEVVLDLSEHYGDGPTFTAGDPYGNHLRFCQPGSSQEVALRPSLEASGS